MAISKREYDKVTKELTNIFMEDKDIEQVHFIEMPKEMLQRDIMSNPITIFNKEYLITWGYSKGIAVVTFCKA